MIKKQQKPTKQLIRTRKAWLAIVFSQALHYFPFIAALPSVSFHKGNRTTLTGTEPPVVSNSLLSKNKLALISTPRSEEPAILKTNSSVSTISQI